MGNKLRTSNKNPGRIRRKAIKKHNKINSKMNSKTSAIEILRLILLKVLIDIKNGLSIHCH